MGNEASLEIRSVYTCVRAYVSLQKPRPREALAAIMALASLIVGPHVHAECRHADVDLVAMRAPPSLLIAQWSVRLAMSSQIRRGRVLLAAIRTFVILVLLRLGLHGADRPSSLGHDRWWRYRRRIDIDARNDRYFREARLFLRGAGRMSRRETNPQGGTLLGSTLQNLPLGLDSLEEEPRSLAQDLVLISHYLDSRSGRQGPARLCRILRDSGRPRSLIDYIAVVNQGARRSRQAHFRQLRQIVQLLGAFGRCLATAFAGAIRSWLTAAVIGQPHASLGTEI